MKYIKTKTGFWLIEFMIILGIVAVLTSIILPIYIQGKKTGDLAKLGLRWDKGSDIIYNPDTKEVVEVNEDCTKIQRTIGKISVSQIVFDSLWGREKKNMTIQFYDTKPVIDVWNTNTPSEIVVNGTKYIRKD